MLDDAHDPERSGQSGGPPLEVVETFEATFAREYPRMVALAAAVSGSRAHAEDIAQEAMSRLDRNWHRVNGFDKPGAWLRRVTINLALSQKRRLASEARAVVRLRPRSAALPPPAVEHRPVWEAVAELPRQQRAAVALHFLEDRSIAEIADILEVSPSTARVHLHRARESLRERLHDYVAGSDSSPPTPEIPAPTAEIEKGTP